MNEMPMKLRNPINPLTISSVLLAFGATTVTAAFEINPVILSLTRQGDTLQLSWQTLSVVTNSGRTPIYPRYIVEASTDLAYWWPTTVVIPQRVGGPSLTLETNFAPAPVLPIAFVRVRSELELQGTDLSDADFRGVDFSGLNLEHTRFHRTLLSGALFTDCQLAYAEFTSAVADTADFYGAEAQRLQANGADFRGANWAYANLDLGVVDGANFEGANLNHAKLNDVSARGTSFNSCSLNESELSGAVCDDASFVNAEFTEADLSYISCVDANLENVDFDECYGEYGDYYGAIMKKSSIRDSDFSVSDFRLVNFSDSEFELTDFRFCDFRGADLDDVASYFCDFTGSQFWGEP